MRRYRLEIGGSEYLLDVQELRSDRYRVQVEGQSYEVRLADDQDLAEAVIRPEILPGRPAVPPPAAGRPAPPDPAPPARTRPLPDGGVGGGLTAPLPGKILSVEVAVGARVSRGQPLLVLEAMKMRNVIKAPEDGLVLEIPVRPEQSVAFGELLMRLGEV